MKTNIRSRKIYYKFFSETAKKYNIDVRVIEAVCLSSFKYLKYAIEDYDELKPIMFSYLGKFKLKKQFENDKRLKFKNEKDDTLGD